MKRMIQNYTFDKTAKTVTLADYSDVTLENLLLITNVTDGAIIYNFADPALGAAVAGNVITLEFDTSAMDNGDRLQVYYDDPAYEPLSNAQNTDTAQLIEAMYDVLEQISFLSSVRGIAADLRVTLLSGALTTLGTVTTVTTVTTVATLTNMVNVGGFSATPQIPSQTNMTAIQSNINNVVVS